jgi:hypothetical protein
MDLLGIVHQQLRFIAKVRKNLLVNVLDLARFDSLIQRALRERAANVTRLLADSALIQTNNFPDMFRFRVAPDQE